MDIGVEAQEHISTAVRLQSLGRYREALAEFFKAAQLYQGAADRRGEGRALNGVGAIYKDMEQFNQAREYLEQALVCRRETKDFRGEAITLTTLGPVYQNLGLPEEAVKALSDAGSILRDMGDIDRYEQVLFNLAGVYSMQSRLGAAYRGFLDAKACAVDPLERLKCDYGLTALCIELGQYREALLRTTALLQMGQRLDNPGLLSSAYHCLGMALGQLNEIGEAEVALRQAIHIDYATGSPSRAIASQLLLASLFAISGRADEAARELDIVRASQPPAELPALQLTETESDIALASENYPQAEALLNKVRSIARGAGDRLAEIRSLYNLAFAAQKCGEDVRSRGYLEAAIGLIEEIRSSIHAEAQRTYFGTFSTQSVYQVYVASLFRAGSTTEAFRMNERRRARTLIERVLRSRGPTALRQHDTTSAFFQAEQIAAIQGKLNCPASAGNGESVPPLR